MNGASHQNEPHGGKSETIKEGMTETAQPVPGVAGRVWVRIMLAGSSPAELEGVYQTGWRELPECGLEAAFGSGRKPAFRQLLRP